MGFSGAAAVTIATVITPDSMSAAWISGAGMPSERKYSMSPLSLPSLPRPEPKNSSPIAMRTASRATHCAPSSLT